MLQDPEPRSPLWLLRRWNAEEHSGRIITGTYDEKRLLCSRLRGEVTRKTLQVKATPIMKHLEATQSRPSSPNDFIMTVL